MTPYDPLLETESAEWVRALTSTGQDRKVAERRLHGLLLKVARSELGRRGSRYAVEGPQREDLAYQVAADSLIAIVGKIGTFRGQSRFTTWAHRFVVFEVSATLARHWRHRSRTAAAGDDWEQRLVGADLEPSVVVEHQDLVDAVRAGIMNVLSDRQRLFFVAIVLDGVPVETVACAHGTNRNAVYKTLFDARRKLRAALVGAGHLSAAGPSTTERSA